MTNEVSTKKKKRKKIMKVLAALMGVFLLIGCCSVGGLMFLGSSMDVSVSTTPTAPFPMVATRHAIRATNEAAITNTPTPTNEPTPTATPLPTATPESTSELDEMVEYTIGALPLLLRYAEAFESMGDLSTKPMFNANGTDFTYEWKREVSVVLTELLIVGGELRNLQPPDCLETSHNLLSEATRHIDASVYLFTEGVDTLDGNLIEQATEELILGQQFLERAREAMNNSTCK